jgi:hypothetical protein
MSDIIITEASRAVKGLQWQRDCQPSKRNQFARLAPEKYSRVGKLSRLLASD